MLSYQSSVSDTKLLTIWTSGNILLTDTDWPNDVIPDFFATSYESTRCMYSLSNNKLRLLILHNHVVTLLPLHVRHLLPPAERVEHIEEGHRHVDEDDQRKKGI